MPKKKINWKTFETDQLSINLPDTFIGGHPTRDRKVLKAEVESLPEEIQFIYKNLFSQRNFAFLAADKAFNKDMSSLTCLVVIPESIPFFQFNPKIENYIRIVKKNLGRDFETIEEDYFEFQGFSSARLLSAQRPRKTRKNPEPEVTRKHLMQAFLIRRHFWSFDCIADAKVFDSFLPIFDESLKSLVLKDKAK